MYAIRSYYVDQKAYRPEQMGGQDDLIETVFEQHQVDMDQAQGLRGAYHDGLSFCLRLD